ncbi:MAG TPA: hypothetical protein PKK15_26085, partial [Kouleothrix sp.]|nr:hypothetical protein [Kouleothrix sp.]
RRMQMVYQDPYGSLNPRMTVRDIIGEPLVVHGLAGDRRAYADRVAELMELVGLLPGMRPSDGACYTPRARELFLAGKRTELERYNRRRAGASGDADLPIGHPYVFQNDTEFIAGYLELFLRSPHAFAAMNPTLFGGLAALLGYDPRGAWAADFRFYIDENRRYYLGGQQPPPAGLTPV